jgi:hypothetical protein
VVVVSGWWVRGEVVVENGGWSREREREGVDVLSRRPKVYVAIGEGQLR